MASGALGREQSVAEGDSAESLLFMGIGDDAGDDDYVPEGAEAAEVEESLPEAKEIVGEGASSASRRTSRSSQSAGRPALFGGTRETAEWPTLKDPSIASLGEQVIMARLDVLARGQDQILEALAGTSRHDAAISSKRRRSVSALMTLLTRDILTCHVKIGPETKGEWWNRDRCGGHGIEQAGPPRYDPRCDRSETERYGTTGRGCVHRQVRGHPASNLSRPDR